MHPGSSGCCCCFTTEAHQRSLCHRGNGHGGVTVRFFFSFLTWILHNKTLPSVSSARNPRRSLFFEGCVEHYRPPRLQPERLEEDQTMDWPMEDDKLVDPPRPAPAREVEGLHTRSEKERQFLNVSLLNSGPRNLERGRNLPRTDGLQACHIAAAPKK